MAGLPRRRYAPHSSPVPCRYGGTRARHFRQRQTAFRKKINGLNMVYEPESLRFFQARFEELAVAMA